MSRTLKTLAVCALAVSMSAPAFAARRTGLANNILIQDKDDVFFFPQALLKYRNLINFDYGATANEGSGMLLLGQPDFGFGILLNRADVTSAALNANALSSLLTTNRNYELGQLGTPPNPYDGTFVAPSTIIDAVIAFSLGGDSAMGFRVGIGNGQDYSKPAGGGGENNNSQFTLKLTGGFSSGDFDASADIFLATGGTIAGGNDVNTGTMFGLTGLIRGFSPMGDKIALGYIGQLGFANWSLTNEAANDTASRVNFGLLGGMGPQYRLESMNAVVAAYAVVAFGYSSFDPSSEGSDDQVTNTQFVLPGARMSLEAYITQWLAFRSGMEYFFAFTGQSDEPGNEAAGREGNQTGSFGWNAGLGLVFDQLTIDGSLSHGWLTQGPDFVGGDSQLFTMVSATYTF